jgi:hypothetical protein
MKLRLMSIVFTAFIVLTACSKYPSKVPGDYYKVQIIGRPAHLDSLVLFTQYTFAFMAQHGQNQFDHLSYRINPSDFIDHGNFIFDQGQNNGSVSFYFIKAGQFRLYVEGTVGSDLYEDSCLVTIRTPSITGDTVIKAGDTTKLYLVPRPTPDSMVPGVMAEWKVNSYSLMITKVTDTFNYSNIGTGTLSIVASFVDTVHRDTAQLDTFSLKIEN